MHSFRFTRRWISGLVVVLMLFLAGCSSGKQSIPTATAVVMPTTAPSAAASPTVASPTVPPTATQPPPTATPRPPTATPTPALGSIDGMVWEDVCPSTEANAAERCQDYKGGQQVGDGKRQEDEFALSGVVVTLSKGSCPGAPLTKTVTDTQGRYHFDGLEAGTYCVSIDTETAPNATLLRPGVWTAPGLEQGYMTVVITPGSVTIINFGRTRLAQAVLPPTQVAQEAATLSPTSSAASATATPQATATPEMPAGPKELGTPTVHDTLAVPSQHWYLNTTPFVKFAPASANGGLLMEVTHPDNQNYWLFSSYPPLKDGYIEGVFVTGPKCNYKDRYGFLVRSPTHYEGVQVMVSCDAFYEIVGWNGGMRMYQYWDRTTFVHPGPGQVNRVGVWLQGKTLRLYINRELVKEVNLDTDIFDEGNFGLVVGAERTGGFRVIVKEISYWELP